MPSKAAPAKINLTLQIVGQRGDGYHLLDSLVVFAGAHDCLSVTPSDTLRLTVSGPFAAGLSAGDDNLVLRAAAGLAGACGVRRGAALHLDKNLPVASGIGGGSSDAAAALRLLAEYWGVTMPPAGLRLLAAGLGADVPVCLDRAACRMGGIGEVLAPAPKIPACGLVLANPGVALATAQVFAARSGPYSAVASLPPSWADAAEMAACLHAVGNDLERPAIGLCPEIGEVLTALRATAGCLLARMSGSGATCFGLFPTPDTAVAVADTLARPGWWCWGGGLWPSLATLYAAPARS